MKKPVKIPQTLIDRLGNKAVFVKVVKPIPGVKKSGKGALEHGWTENPYKADDPELQEWLAQGGNYGVLCGKGIYEVDLDDPATIKKFEERIKTFTVKSGSGHGRHYYINTNIHDNGAINRILKNGKLKNLGNIQYKNKHVVGPNSVHYTGGVYEIIRDVEIAWVEKEELEEIFGDELKWAHASRKTAAEFAKKENDIIGSEIPIKELIDNFDELKEINSGEYQGQHPVHGSSTGINFNVNIDMNCWHCFRCNSGGGPLSWLAVKGGLIRCDEAISGILKGPLFWDTIALAKKAGYEINISSDEELNKDVSKYFENDKAGRPHFIPPKLAVELMRKFHYVTREDSKVIFVYNSETGTYSPTGEAHIQRQCVLALGKSFRKHRAIEVIYYIYCKTIQKVKETPPHIIAVKNGLLDIKTRKLIPFSPKYFILYGSSAEYKPGASQNSILKFVSEIVDGKHRLTLQELAGYCLWRGYPIHKAFMLVGIGRNGKSTILKVIIELIGRENAISIPLHELEGYRFSRGNLYGKAANICADLPDRALKFTGMFKQLCGGDPITANIKFKGQFTFYNTAKLVFACNKVPENKGDDTDAFFARWCIITFPNQFLEGDPKTDINIFEKLTTPENLSGILNWALDGLERLMKNRAFSSTEGIDESRKQYLRASAPVKAFAMDMLVNAPGEVITKSDLYRDFIKYCKRLNLPSMGKYKFGRELVQHMPNAVSIQATISGKSARCWGDIKLAPHANSANLGPFTTRKNESIKVKKEVRKGPRNALNARKEKDTWLDNDRSEVGENGER